MVQRKNSFERKPEYIMGHLGEGRIAKWLNSRGNSVMPVYQLEMDQGKGPQYYTPDESLVAPDLLVFGDKGITWIEAKTKTVFTWHRNTERWVTGIDLHHYRHYQQVAMDSGLPVWLLFLHTSAIPAPRDVESGSPASCPVGLFGGSLEFLADNENHCCPPKHGDAGHGRSGMVYWASDKLRLMEPILNIPS